METTPTKFLLRGCRKMVIKTLTMVAKVEIWSHKATCWRNKKKTTKQTNKNNKNVTFEIIQTFEIKQELVWRYGRYLPGRYIWRQEEADITDKATCW